MHQQVTFSMFVDAFRSMGRENQFSVIHARGASLGAYEALRVIYDYLEDRQDDPYELDVIAICCEFSHDTATEIADQYGLACINLRDMTQDECDDAVREYLQDQGVYVGETEHGFVYLQH